MRRQQSVTRSSFVSVSPFRHSVFRCAKLVAAIFPRPRLVSHFRQIRAAVGVSVDSRTGCIYHSRQSDFSFFARVVLLFIHLAPFCPCQTLRDLALAPAPKPSRPRSSRALAVAIASVPIDTVAVANNKTQLQRRFYRVSRRATSPVARGLPAAMIGAAGASAKSVECRR